MTRAAFSEDVAVGLLTRDGADPIEVAAGARAGLVAVAAGLGGYGTGWLGARLTVRALLQRAGCADDDRLQLVGAAARFPSRWAWPGSGRTSVDARRLYAACEAGLGDPGVDGRELDDVLRDLDQALHRLPTLDAALHDPLVSCLAARLDGGQLVGAHVGVGEVVRATDDGALERVVRPHYLHRVADRVPALRDADPAALPTDVVANGLGLGAHGLGRDPFAVALDDRIVLLTSAGLPLPEELLVDLLRTAERRGQSLDELVQAVADAVPRGDGRPDRDLAFALVRAGDAATPRRGRAARHTLHASPHRQIWVELDRVVVEASPGVGRVGLGPAQLARGEPAPLPLASDVPAAEASALAEVVDLVRQRILYATPSCAVAVRRDDARLTLRGRGLSIEVPIHALSELTMHDRCPEAWTRTVASGLAPSQPRWVRAAWGPELAACIGPLSPRSAAALVEDFAAWRSEHPIPAEVIEISTARLRATPTRWHLQRVRTTGTWRVAPETSDFAGVWLDATPPSGSGTFEIRVTGTWIYPDATPGETYGHLGGWPGTLLAELVEFLAPAA